MYKSVVKIKYLDTITKDEFIGSGVIFSKDGLVLTNNHIIENEDFGTALGNLAICIIDKIDESPVCDYEGELIIRNDENDLAILKIKSYDKGIFVPILNKYVDSNKESFFELAIRIIGYPTLGGEGITITRGIVSGFDEDKNLKTDSEVNHGNSGGGAFDENNNFIGIPSFLISSDSGKISFIIPVYKIRDWFNNILNFTVTPKTEMSLEIFNESNLNYDGNLSTEPQNARIISKFALIESLLKEQEYLEIPEQIEYILNERPYSSLAYQYLGNAYLGLNMYSEASEAYQASIELNPYKISTLGNYAIVLANLKKYEEAIQINEQIILVTDQSLYKALAYNNLGEIYALLGDYNLAVENFLQALGRCPVDCPNNELIRYNLRNAMEQRNYSQ